MNNICDTPGKSLVSPSACPIISCLKCFILVLKNQDLLSCVAYTQLKKSFLTYPENRTFETASIIVQTSNQTKKIFNLFSPM